MSVVFNLKRQNETLKAHITALKHHGSCQEEEIKKLKERNESLEKSLNYYKSGCGKKYKPFTKDHQAQDCKAVLLRVSSFLPTLDDDGAETDICQLQTVEHVIYHYNTPAERRNNNIGDQADDMTLLMRLGWHLHDLLFSKKRPKRSKNDQNNQTRTFGDLQRRMLEDPSLLYRFVHVLCSSQQSIPTLPEFCSLNAYQRQALHNAFAATSHMEMAQIVYNGSQELHPYILYNRSLHQAYDMAPRLSWFFIKMGTLISSNQTKDSKQIILSASAFQWIKKKHFPKGTVELLCMDNVNTSNKETMKALSVRVASRCTPRDLATLGFLDHFVEEKGQPRVGIKLPFRDAFEKAEDIAHPRGIDWNALDRLSIARLESGFELTLEMYKKLDADWISDLIWQCDGSKEACKSVAGQWTKAGVRIPSLAGALVRGTPYPGCPEMPNDWEARMPTNPDMQFSLYRNSNVINGGIDIVDQCVGSTEGITNIMMQGQMECGIGPDYLKQYQQDPRPSGPFPTLESQFSEEEMKEPHGIYNLAKEYLEARKAGMLIYGGDLAGVKIYQKLLDDAAAKQKKIDANIDLTEQEKETDEIENGHTNSSMCAFHVAMEVARCVGKIFDGVFLRDWLKVIFPTPTQQDYLLFPPDPRPRTEVEAQIGMAVGVALVLAFKEYLEDKNEDIDELNALDLNAYMMLLVKKRPSLFPLILYMRCCDIFSGLRSSAKCDKRGDFNLYMNMSNIAQLLYTVTNAMHYNINTMNQRVDLETCTKLEFMCQAGLIFTALSEAENSMAFGEKQEKYVKVCRTVSPNPNKKHTLNVAIQWRFNVQHSDESMATRRGVKNELPFVEERETEEQREQRVTADFNMNNDAANETNDDVLAADLVDHLDDNNKNLDPTRPRNVHPIYVSVLRMLLQQKIFSHNTAVDASGIEIPDHELHSVVSMNNPKKTPSHVILELPTLMMERSKDIVEERYIGPAVDGTSGETKTTEHHGRNRGPPTTRNMATRFYKPRMTQEHTELQISFYKDRLETTNEYLLRHHQFGTSPGMLMPLDMLKEELARLKDRGSTVSAKQNWLTRIPDKFTAKHGKKVLCKLLSNIRQAGIKPSSELKRACTFKPRVSRHGNNWRRLAPGSTNPTGFRPFEQPLFAIGSNATADKTFDLNWEEGEESESGSDEDILQTAADGATLLLGGSSDGSDSNSSSATDSSDSDDA